MNAAAIGGAKARKDPRRDCWRTPAAFSALVQNHLLCAWDASGRGPEEWAHGFGWGNVGDAITNTWPIDRVVFVNAPFSLMGEWAARIVRHAGPVVVLCPLRPSSAWFDLLIGTPAHLAFPPWGVPPTGWRHMPTGRGVELILLRKRVAYDPPPGGKKSSPSFDSCLVLRGGG